MILSLSVHEYAHGLTAKAFGDRTAEREGRLTLNPQSHIDPVGTILFPVLSVLSGGVAFLGWAKPTPVNASEFRPGINKRLGLAIVSAAGPLSNLLLAVLSAAGIWYCSTHGVALTRAAEDMPNAHTPFGILLHAMLRMNIALFVFNLLPVPPLDGHRLIPPLGRGMAPQMEWLSKYGFAAVMLILMFMPPVAEVILYGPIRKAEHLVLSLFGLA